MRSTSLFPPIFLALASPVSADATGSFVGAVGLGMPSTFTGSLSCAFCAGIAHHLDLWPDGIYHMRRTWLRDDGDYQRDEIGRWFADPGRSAVILHGASEMPMQWQVMAEDRLRQLDIEGNPIESTLNYELTSDGRLNPTDIEGVFMSGMVRLSGEAATFDDCLTERTYRILGDVAYDDLASSYEAGFHAPGATLFARVEATLQMQGGQAAENGGGMVVDRVIETDPDRQCETPSDQAALTDPYGGFDTLRGDPVMAPPKIREPYLVLFQGDDARFSASIGCNQLSGSYSAGADAMTFGAAISKRVACLPPLDTLEQRLQEAIAVSRTYRHENVSLTLMDDAGQIIGDLTAVYFRRD